MSIQNELAELHKYNCGSEGARADLAKDYGLQPYPKEATDLSYKQEPFTPEEQKIWDEACKMSDKLADAEMDHIFDSTSAIAFQILELLKGSTCGYCGQAETDPDMEYGYTYDHALMNIFEVVAHELMERGDKLEHGLFKKSDLLQRLVALNPSKQAA